MDGKPLAKSNAVSDMGLHTPIADWLGDAPDPSGEPKRGYLICATPRSGSYFLCDLLRSSGCLGRPHEYFEAAAMRRHGALDYPGDLAAQIGIARSGGSTANGIFGAKIFPAQVGGTAAAKIREGFGNPVMIFLVRHDLTGQAISLARAAQTRQFFAGHGPRTVPPFDARLIRDYLERILRWNAAWEVYFARTGVAPLRLVYEDVVSAPQTAVDRIAQTFDLPTPARIDHSLLSMRVQRDATSDEWRARFIAAQPRELFPVAPRSESAAAWQRRIRRLARLLGRRNDG